MSPETPRARRRRRLLAGRRRQSCASCSCTARSTRTFAAEGQGRPGRDAPGDRRARDRRRDRPHIGLGAPLGTVEYKLPDGRDKIVYYWASAEAAAATRAPSSRTTRSSSSTWVPLDRRSGAQLRARRRHHRSFRPTLRAGPARTFAIVALRHGKAMPPAWDGPDATRPLQRGAIGDERRTRRRRLPTGTAHLVERGTLPADGRAARRAHRHRAEGDRRHQPGGVDRPSGGARGAHRQGRAEAPGHRAVLTRADHPGDRHRGRARGGCAGVGAHAPRVDAPHGRVHRAARERGRAAGARGARDALAAGAPEPLPAPPPAATGGWWTRSSLWTRSSRSGSEERVRRTCGVHIDAAS